jgi:hypothetical protein
MVYFSIILPFVFTFLKLGEVFGPKFVRTIHYLVQQIVQSVIIIIGHLSPSYLFRPPQGYHQGCNYEGLQVEQTLRYACMELKY